MANDGQHDEQMLYIGFCRVCGTGPLGLRVCGSCDNLLVVCDECDSVWVDGDTSQMPSTTGTETLPCPHCEGNLYSTTSHWASIDEAEKSEWLMTAMREDRLSLEVGKPLAPPDV